MSDQRESPPPEPVIVVGAGYVGLVTAAGLAELGHAVWVVDVEDERIQMLRDGRVPITEPGLTEAFQKHCEALHFETKLSDAIRASGARLVFVAVGTPTTRRDDSGGADLEFVDCVVQDLLCESGELALVMKSTVPPGTGNAIRENPAFREKDFAYVSCPEFLMEGEALKGVSNPDRVVIGRQEGCWAAAAVRDIHLALKPVPTIFETDIASAEMIKVVSNVMLAMRVSCANEVANVSEEVGADSSDVMYGVGLDARIGPEFLRPGAGFGGSCFAKDVKSFRAVAVAHDVTVHLPSAVLDSNEAQTERIVAKLQARIGSLETVPVAVLGLAFKPGTDDVRESPALRLATALRSAGAVVQGFDPDPGVRTKVVRHSRLAEPRDWLADREVYPTAQDAMTGVRACVVVTGWSDFASIDWRAAAQAMTGNLVLDCPGILDASRVSAAGLAYEGVGRASPGISQGVLGVG